MPDYLEPKDKGHIDSIKIEHKPGSVDNRMVDPGLFPFDAFEYDDPNKTDTPMVKLKEAWKFDGTYIGAGTIVADRIAIGGASKIYKQPLAPEVGYAFDTWIDSNNNTKYEHMYNVESSKGGAGADVTTFDSTVGGAPANNSSWDSTYGNIPSYVGWFTTLYNGITSINGGRIKTDSLKSWNYIQGVQGSKFDLSNGYIETGDGEFRGDLNAAGGTFTGDLSIGVDDANRQLSLGSKGLLVKDANGVIIHDLPDAAIQSGNYYLGHILWFQGDSSTYQIYNSTTFTNNAWNNNILCVTDGNTNIKGGIFDVVITGYMTSGNYNYREFAQITLRPNGTSWNYSYLSGVAPTLYHRFDLSGDYVQKAELRGLLICPILNRAIDAYLMIDPYDGGRRAIINQIGMII